MGGYSSKSTILNPFVKTNLDILKKIRLLKLKANQLILDGGIIIDDIDNGNFVSTRGVIEKEIEAYKNEINEIKEKIKLEEDKIKMYNENVKNIEKEIESASSDNVRKLRRELQVLPFHIKVANKNIDDFNADILEKEKALEKCSKNINNISKQELNSDKSECSDSSDYKTRLNETIKSINDVVGMLNNDVRTIYEKISSNINSLEDGMPVAIIKNGFCENCNILVPLQQMIDVLGMGRFVMCESCGCFFVDVENDDNKKEI